jgi:replicative DNA helicase
MIVIDEMDYMSPDDLNAIMAMMQTTSANFSGRKRIIVSSTPTGRRDMFYLFANMPHVQEYWNPSFANPFFTPADEKEQRETLTEHGFIHEIVADWGEQATGVFKPSLLEHNSSEESYWHARPRLLKDVPIICGVDWDKYGAGVNIVVVANVAGILRIVHREEVTRQEHEFTLGAGVDRIIDLDKLFQFAYVYTDKGYGERQYEELVEKLPRGELRVQGRNFSSKVEETDPATGLTVTEEFKPFMVDNATILWEKRKLHVKSDDEVFISQLLGYIRVRMSSTGRPVFGSIDPERIGDHALDGWMLALLGHTEKFGDLVTSFEVMLPHTATTSNSLQTGDSAEERQRQAAAGHKVFNRPMSSTNRWRSRTSFERGAI